MAKIGKYFLAVIIVLWIIPTYSALAQQIQIEGTVTYTSGYPIEGAKISVNGNPEVKALTDENGQFTIIAENGAQLQVKDPNGKNKTVTIRQQDIHITLNKNKAAEKIHLGYGITRTPYELTSAVGKVGAENLSKGIVLNPENALYGQIPGLIVLRNSGLPPTSPTFLVRGRSTFRSSNPLVLVDGFDRPFSTLSMEEIESVTVMKDAAALAKYGQRGANGVILVTTKRGRKNMKDRITASYNQGITQPTVQPNFVGAATYARALNEARANDGRQPRYEAAELKAYDSGAYPNLYPNVNWFDKVLRSYGVRSNYNFSYRGGSERIRYFATLNYLGDNGLFGPTERNDGYSTQLKYRRFNARTNLDIELTDNLLLQTDVAGDLVSQNRPGAGNGANQIYNAMYSIPSASFPIKTAYGQWGGTNIYDNNPMAILTSTGYGQPNWREFSLTGKLKYNLDRWLKGLQAEGAVSYYNYGQFSESHSKTYSYTSVVPEFNPDGYIVDTRRTHYGNTTELNYWSNLGGGRIYTNVHGKLNYTRTQSNYNLKAAIFFRQTSRERNGRNNTHLYRNFAGTVHFGWEKKYFFGLSSSYSGSNLLPAGNRYGFFPAISAGWMISREKFLQNIQFLDRLKLRASWGMAGSANLPANEPYKEDYGPGGGGYWFRDGIRHQGGYVERRIESPNFTFATSYNTNIGLDATLFNKLELTADWFYTRRENILTDTGGRYSEVLGISPPIESNGIVKNQGIEASLSWHDVIGEVAYRIGGQFSFARNEVVNMNEPYRPYSYLRRTGRPIGQQFGLQAIGFFKDQDDITSSPKQNFSEVKPGDIKYKDQNEDGIINKYDKVPLGFSSGYPQIYFSVSLGVNYKGFEISALFQGTGNYTAYLNTKSVFWPIQNNNTISEYYYNRRWTSSTTSATYPRLTTKHSDNNFQPNSIWLVDRSFIKLRNLEVSYSLPKSFIQSLAISDIQIVGRGRNIFSIDDIPVLDPEYLGTGYPLLRSYSLGLKIEF